MHLFLSLSLCVSLLFQTKTTNPPLTANPAITTIRKPNPLPLPTPPATNPHHPQPQPPTTKITNKSQTQNHITNKSQTQNQITNKLQTQNQITTNHKLKPTTAEPPRTNKNKILSDPQRTKKQKQKHQNPQSTR